jgi:hypothetical protein
MAGNFTKNDRRFLLEEVSQEPYNKMFQIIVILRIHFAMCHDEPACVWKKLSSASAKFGVLQH